MEDLVLSCLESRVEDNRNLYARFLIGPFLKGDALTVATALRRVLLSSIESIGITALYIQGITHEFSTIVGVRESVLELSLNFQAIVLSYDKIFFQKKSFFDTIQIGYLQVQGPKVIYANDLKLPLGVKLVDPTQYIATVSKEGSIVLKFIIGKRNNFLHQNSGPESYFGNPTRDLPITGKVGKKNIVRAKKTCCYKKGSTVDWLPRKQSIKKRLQQQSTGAEVSPFITDSKSFIQKACLFPKFSFWGNALKEKRNGSYKLRHFVLSRKLEALDVVRLGRFLTPPKGRKVAYKYKSLLDTNTSTYKSFWSYKGSYKSLPIFTRTTSDQESMYRKKEIGPVRTPEGGNPLFPRRGSEQNVAFFPQRGSEQKDVSTGLALYKKVFRRKTWFCKQNLGTVAKACTGPSGKKVMGFLAKKSFILQSLKYKKQNTLYRSATHTSELQSPTRFTDLQSASYRKHNFGYKNSFCQRQYAYKKSNLFSLCKSKLFKKKDLEFKAKAGKPNFSSYGSCLLTRKTLQQSWLGGSGVRLTFVLKEIEKKHNINKKKSLFLSSNDTSFKSNICLRNVIPLDFTLTPVLKVNFVVEIDDEVLYLRQKIRERIILEIWTNGSVHPRQAVHDAALSLTDIFASFRSVYQLKP